MGGVGGTLAGNALSLAAMRATLEHVLTDEAFDAHGRARRRASRPACRRRSTAHGLPWSRQPARRPGRVPLRRPGRRAPARSRPPRATPSSTTTCTSYLANRGVLLTPFHNMALMSPATGVADVATHLWAFAEAVAALAA